MGRSCASCARDINTSLYVMPGAGQICREQIWAAVLARRAEHRMCEPIETGTGSILAYLTKRWHCGQDNG